MTDSEEILREVVASAAVAEREKARTARLAGDPLAAEAHLMRAALLADLVDDVLREARK